MRELNELRQKRTKVIEQMGAILEAAKAEKRDLSENDILRYDLLNNEITYQLDPKISVLERQDEMNRTMAGDTFVNKSLSSPSFRDWVNKTITGETKENFKMSFRADPWISSTDTGLIQKDIQPISHIVTPSETLLRNLGIKFYRGIKGNLVLPKMDESIAGWVSEAADASTADLATTSLTLVPQRVSHFQSITRETVAQTTNVVDAILYNLVNGIWKAIGQKFFSELQTDCASQIITNTNPPTITFENICNMEASLGGIDLIRPAYVMKPQTKAYLKKTAALSNQEAIWKNDKVNEFPAYATPLLTNERMILGDFSKGVVSFFGDQDITIIMDPFTDAKSGKITFTALAMADCGIHNKSAFVLWNDCSTY